MPDHSSVSDLLRDGQRQLRDAGSDAPSLEAEILLREALGATREQLYGMFPAPVENSVATAFSQMLERRRAGTPISYITGRRAFYRHEFVVDENVLIPRPETEWLVEWSVGWLTRHEIHHGTVIDVGTGSGAIGISIALETCGSHYVIGSDVSINALKVARRNRDRLGAEMDLVAGSVLDWSRAPLDLIAVNLPYLRPDQRHPGIEQEPAVALFAGHDGFDLNRALLEQASYLLATPGGLIMEIDPDQAETARAEAGRWFGDASNRVEMDLAGFPRYLIVER